jgi:methyl-accepting chemotaxis protein
VGRLAEALETFKANLVESRRLAAEQDGERAAKERRATMVAAAVGDFERSVSDDGGDRHGGLGGARGRRDQR